MALADPPQDDPFTYVSAALRPWCRTLEQAMIGRRTELLELRQHLTQSPHRLVTVTGPAGVGKSVLVEEAVAGLRPVFAGGVLRVAVEELPHATAMQAAVAALLDKATGVDDARPVLLVLDGCDALVQPCGELVTAALARVPRLRVLVTSRQLLRVEGEVVLQVPPLSKDESVELFVARADRLLPGFHLDARSTSVVEAIATALGGVPLAVVLAAARVSVLSPQGILDRLDDPCRLLSKGEPGAGARQRSLRASLAESARLCTDEERQMWGRMSVFATPVTLEAVEAVCTGDGIEVAEVLDLVDGLLDKSVLVRDGSDADQVRYRLLEPLRAYGVEMVGTEQDRWLRRHDAWALARLEEAAAGWFTEAQETWLAVLRREYAEVASMVERILAPVIDPGGTGDLQPRLRRLVGALVALMPVWVWMGHSRRVEEWLRRAAELAEDRHLRAEALEGTGWGVVLAATTAGRSEVVPPSTLAEVRAAMAEGRYGAAAEGLVEVARGARAGGTPHLEAVADLLLAQARALARDPADATAAAQRCLRVTRQVGDRLVRAWCLVVLGHLAWDGRELGVVEAAAREALDAADEVGQWLGLDDGRHLAPALALLGRLAADQDQPERAAVLLGAADARWHPACLPEALARTAVLRSRAATAARAALGERRWRDCRGRGEAMNDEQVVRCARDGVLVPEQRHRGRGGVDDSVLTAREAEVAGLVADGLSNREVAARLSISTRTAQGHVESILRKLAFGSRAQVAAWVASRAAAPDAVRSGDSVRDVAPTVRGCR